MLQKALAIRLMCLKSVSNAVVLLWPTSEAKRKAIAPHTTIIMEYRSIMTQQQP